MNQKCPKCDGKLIEKLHGDDLTKVDRCDQCRGLWFDHGELAVLKKFEDRTAEFWQRIEQAIVTQHPCPRCPSIKLVEMPYLDEPLLRQYDVHIDFCIKCHGLWLDDGEITKIVKIETAAVFKDDFWKVVMKLEESS